MAQPILKFPDYWSEADLGDLPADGHRYEIVDGSLLVTPPPLDSHQAISGNLYFILRTAAPAGWRVLYEVGVRVPGGNFIPDLVVLKPDSARGSNGASHPTLPSSSRLLRAQLNSSIGV